MMLNLFAGKALLPQRRIQEIRLCTALFNKAGVYRPDRLYLRLLCLMTSSKLLVPYARLNKRPFQFFHLHSHWIAVFQGLEYPVIVGRSLLPHTHMWNNRTNLGLGLSLLKNKRALVLTTDVPEMALGPHEPFSIV